MKCFNNLDISPCIMHLGVKWRWNRSCNGSFTKSNEWYGIKKNGIMTSKIPNLQSVVKEMNIFFKSTFWPIIHYMTCSCFPYKIEVIDIIFFIRINKILNKTKNVETTMRLWEVLYTVGLLAHSQRQLSCKCKLIGSFY